MPPNSCISQMTAVQTSFAAVPTFSALNMTCMDVATGATSQLFVNGYDYPFADGPAILETLQASSTVCLTGGREVLLPGKLLMGFPARP